MNYNTTHRICVMGLNWTISLKTQHVSKAQTPHVLITSILIKRQRLLIHLLSRLAFLTTIVWFVQCFARHFVSVHQNLYTTGLITTIIKEEFENVLYQRIVSWSIFEEFIETLLATLNNTLNKKEKNSI